MSPGQTPVGRSQGWVGRVCRTTEPVCLQLEAWLPEGAVVVCLDIALRKRVIVRAFAHGVGTATLDGWRPPRGEVGVILAELLYPDGLVRWTWVACGQQRLQGPFDTLVLA